MLLNIWPEEQKNMVFLLFLIVPQKILQSGPISLFFLQKNVRIKRQLKIIVPHLFREHLKHLKVQKVMGC
jgi:hypothetical protein